MRAGVKRELVRFLKCFLFMVIVLLATGCNPTHQPEQNKELSTNRDLHKNEPKSASQLIEEEEIISLELNEGLFHSVADWKDKETIFYIMNNKDGSTVYTYNIFNGEASIFYESEVPIVRFEANKSHSLFLIHTSPSSYEAELIVLDKNANLKFTTKIESYELQTMWNQIDNNQLFVSSFNEDWTFQTYLINVAENSINENPVDFPFIQWLNGNEVSYLKWDQNAPSLSAPLYIYDIKKQEETLLSKNVVANTNYDKVLSTFELLDENGAAVIKFYDMNSRKLIADMPTNLVALYSDWAIPFHDMASKGNHFYTFEINDKKTAFSLISYEIETEEKKTLIENIENLPFLLSPTGEYALYGARYEKIIRLADKTIKDLVKLIAN